MQSAIWKPTEISGRHDRILRKEHVIDRFIRFVHTSFDRSFTRVSFFATRSNASGSKELRSLLTDFPLMSGFMGG
jgi:hypothetical protein